MSLCVHGLRQAVLRASSLAQHALSFFAVLRSTMQHLKPSQIDQIIATWRGQMRERDAAIRRQIEVGLHRMTLQSYANHCDAHLGQGHPSWTTCFRVIYS